MMTEQPDNTTTASAEAKLSLHKPRLHTRVWAVLMIVLVSWTAYQAIAYLVTFVFGSSRVPELVLVERPPLNTQALRDAEQQQHPLMSDGRAPLRHYHTVKPWHSIDPRNGCTASGCHTPLPHTRNKDFRAFANLHGTFLDCQMCHEKKLGDKIEASWVSLETGEPISSPALLRLIVLLDKADTPQGETAVHDEVVALLQEVVEISGQDPLLKYLLVRLQTTESGSRIHLHTQADLKEELAKHARGEYRAKLVPTVAGRDYEKFHGDLAELAKAYSESNDKTERTKLFIKAHASVAMRPPGCLVCHEEKSSQLDFAALGYLPARVTELQGAPIAKMMQHIHEGVPFRSPTLLQGDAER